MPWECSAGPRNHAAPKTTGRRPVGTSDDTDLASPNHLAITAGQGVAGGRYPSRDSSVRTAGVHALAGWFPVSLQMAAVR
jgi:hypothetical protein